MPYSLSYVIELNEGDTGLTLEAQLKDSSNVNVGAAITAGFSEIGKGLYGFAATAIPDGHRGWFVFQDSVGGTIRASGSVNPEEAENIDAKVTTRSDFDEATDPVELLDTGGAAGTSADELVNDVWAKALEGTLTAEELMRLISATLLGQLSGAGGVSITIKAADIAGTTRIVATVDANGNRSSLTLTP